jgi:hypothetical protein
MRRNVDNTFYDALEESEFEMEVKTAHGTLHQKAVSEPTRKTRPGMTLTPVLAGYSTSDDEVAKGAQRQHTQLAQLLLFQRASWPKTPSCPNTTHHSGVQGIEDTVSGNDERKSRASERRCFRGCHISKPAQNDEASIIFRGIADADSGEERWGQMKLEEHMDKIFNAVPQPVDVEAAETADVAIDKSVREKPPKTTNIPGLLPGDKGRFRDYLLSLPRLFGCVRMFEGGK